ncbi:MAG: hypothetical protein K2X57_15040 [Xanthobacteraceae bacterium]|nr:hypothetical protein [Xanthobacteraceae bacterium]
MTPKPASNILIFEPQCYPIDLPSVTGRQWHALRFDMEQQEKSNWCWAAVAASVAHFFRPADPVKQCSIANGELRRSDCCANCDGADDPCNVPGYMMSSLYRVGHFRKWLARQAPGPGQIEKEFHRGYPLCARVVWNGGGSHYLTIVGYAKPADSPSDCMTGVAVADPWFGLSDIDYADFPKRYAIGGICTDSYYTRS